MKHNSDFENSRNFQSSKVQSKLHDSLVSNDQMSPSEIPERHNQ